MQKLSNIEPEMVFQDTHSSKLHKGFYNFHEDVGFNFQMNRWVSYLGEIGVEAMKAIAPKIKNYEDWKREFLALGEKSLSEGEVILAAYCYRSADFFTFADSPDKKELREKFLKLMNEGFNIEGLTKYMIPYENDSEKGFLPAYRLTPENPDGTLVIFGGFDSYIEEIFPIITYLADNGYDVICFDGPGQGGALEDYNIHMIPEWEKPVKSVLDFFQVDNVTLMGVSLGGCLVIRAAAHEPRVERVIAFDIMYDFLESNLKSMAEVDKLNIKKSLAMGSSEPVNLLLNKMIKDSYFLEWGIKQGKHITGTTTPFDYMSAIEKYNTKNVSNMINQDVLLMAGSEDHYVPVDQLYSQGKALTNAHSLTMRLFTKGEDAQNHCQVGNMGIAIDTILSWIALQQKEE